MRRCNGLLPKAESNTHVVVRTSRDRALPGPPEYPWGCRLLYTAGRVAHTTEGLFWEGKKPGSLVICTGRAKNITRASSIEAVGHRVRGILSQAIHREFGSAFGSQAFLPSRIRMCGAQKVEGTKCA